MGESKNEIVRVSSWLPDNRKLFLVVATPPKLPDAIVKVSVELSASRLTPPTDIVLNV